jgi:hypothetical protein
MKSLGDTKEIKYIDAAPKYRDAEGTLVKILPFNYP